MNTKRLVIATRQSKLALWQANFIKARLEAAHEGLVVELHGMTTTGDRWLDSPLSEVGGKGLFIKALEDAMLAGTADVAVHSMKDVPAELPEGFALPVIAFRADVRDALVSRSGATLAELPAGAKIGSSSLRRQAMLLSHRADLEVAPVRGNVDTRLAKLDAGDYDALVLAAAGLERLELAGRITEHLPVTLALPAAGQGALGIECRADRPDVIELLAPLDDSDVHACVAAERLVSAGLGADCSAPLGAHAVLANGELDLAAVLAEPTGERVLTARSAHAHPAQASAAVVAQLLEQGAAALLGKLA